MLSTTAPPPGVPSSVVQAVRDILTHWLQANSSGLAPYLDDHSVWADDSRIKTRNFATGAASILQYIKQDWGQYDCGASGILAVMEVTNLRLTSLGTSSSGGASSSGATAASTLSYYGVTFSRHLSANPSSAASSVPPAHWFIDKAFQSFVFSLPTSSAAAKAVPRLVQSITVTDFALLTKQELTKRGIWGRSLDYTAVPTRTTGEILSISPGPPPESAAFCLP